MACDELFYFNSFIFMHWLLSDNYFGYETSGGLEIHVLVFRLHGYGENLFKLLSDYNTVTEELVREKRHIWY